ncbi:7-carboxy-7-deazaguanine synthase QueE [Blattabacterium sp. (Blaberus giganteus)]|uniref:7-carboxy-7-deazaguanine synthase QueE n=1 Tax=Blattabacterium sp. (Blaberus giganteus) TaxID=1186051 RepID=UPI00025F6EC5|nr:7-carboxy-7-deazaguanine synthase QueE [Blattabacterium sp. (Blaberus giganteus)]AFJ90646.1 radical SAM domain-containing protein [Blattabacterium sp. (Blaberus giganteus)]
MKEISYPIKESFYSIQGEGHFYGIAAYFIRFEGCNIKCDWCDTKESWNIKKKDFVPIHKIIANINNYKVKTVIITGGEPMMWDLYPLIKKLKKKEYRIHIETSGFYPIKEKYVDWITISPKKIKRPIQENYKKINELKIIISDENDFFFAEEQANYVKSKNCFLFLQPEWTNIFRIIPKIISYIKENPKWRISLQIHKMLNIP